MKTLMGVLLITSVLGGTGQAAEMSAWMQRFDTDHDGRLTFEEFMTGSKAQKGAQFDVQRATQFFEKKDANNDGVISEEEGRKQQVQASSTPSASISSNQDFSRWNKNGHDYKAVHTPQGISWTQARAEAEAAGGYLATITSLDENKFIARLVRDEKFWSRYGSHDLLGPWIGGYQQEGAREPDQGWCWVTGEPFFFANWAPVEPSGRWKGQDENRLQFYSKSNFQTGRWNDAVDFLEELPVYGYIIEKGAVNIAPHTIAEKPRSPEYRKFTAADGKSIYGKVVAFDCYRKVVSIEREDGYTARVSLADLSQSDQAYAHEWNLLKEFNKKDRIRITAKQKKCAEDKDMPVHDQEGNKFGMNTMESIGYDITVQNGMGIVLTDLSVDYCIYYEQDRPGGIHPVKGLGVKCGTLEIGTLAPKQKITQETQPALLFCRERYWDHGRDSGYTFEGEVLGIWIRIYHPLSDGRVVMRECSKPADIKDDYAWASSDVPVLPPNWP